MFTSRGNLKKLTYIDRIQNTKKFIQSGTSPLLLDLVTGAASVQGLDASASALTLKAFSTWDMGEIVS